MKKFSLGLFLQKYPDNDACLEKIKQLRWPNGITCPECQKITKFYKITGQTAYACEFGGHRVYPLAGTIFEKTTTPLQYWFYAIYIMTQTRSGVSAKQLQRELGVTYKTAWRMLKQIRTLMVDDINFTEGTVEIDETYVGGKPRLHENWEEKMKKKQAIMGMVQRDGKVYLKHVESTGKWAVLEQIKPRISSKVRVITDEWPSYTQLKYHGYDHDVITHKKHYVKGDIHTQNIENVWSHLKRGIY